MKRFEIIIKTVLPYFAAFALIFALMFFGSREKTIVANNSIFSGLSDNNISLTTDQISEAYTVANISTLAALPSSVTVNDNYVTLSSVYDMTGQISANDTTTIIEKPKMVDTSELQRGVISYVVQEGDTLDSIISALRLSATKDQIRWSNNLKNETINVGDTLYLPSIAGIVYTVKSGDTIDSIVEKYKTNREQLISYNDLEDSDIAEAMRIVLPGGTLPENERPEYVAPVRRYTYNYSYYASGSSNRQGMFQIQSYAYWRNMYYSGVAGASGNPGAFGNCTWFAWYWRNSQVAAGNLPANYQLPGGRLGNARDWVGTLSAHRFAWGKTPSYGAIFQSTSGSTGHVGVVIGVNEGVSITIQEMNWAGPAGKFNVVHQSTISWSDALSFNYIYGN